MKKYLFVIMILLGLGLIISGCSEIIKVSAPILDNECVNYLSRLSTNNGLTCEDFEGLEKEYDITGTGKIYENLDIFCYGNDITLKVILENDATFPSYNYWDGVDHNQYNGYLNGEMGLGVVSTGDPWSRDPASPDYLDFHTIVFDFINGVTVSDFSIYMLDYGDMCHNQGGLTTYKTYIVTLNAYDKDGNVVDTYAFKILNDPNAGQGKTKYDASQIDGQQTLSVAHAGISKVEIVFTEGIDLGIGFDDICFTVEPPMEVPLDIKPTSCPNPLNTKSNGVIPVAILGTAEFDVTQIDPETIELGLEGLLGVIPLSWAYEDVATPFEPYTEKEDCMDCNEDGPDGYTDLTLKFDAQVLFPAIGAVQTEYLEEQVTLQMLEDGDCVVLTLTGNLLENFGGTPFTGEDVVKILKKGK